MITWTREYDAGPWRRWSAVVNIPGPMGGSFAWPFFGPFRWYVRLFEIRPYLRASRARARHR